MMIETDYRALIRAGQDGLPIHANGGVVAIGNFDGVHRGHKALLALGKTHANAIDAPLVVLTFAPHPRRVFQPQSPPFQLSDSVMRAEYLRSCGADAVVQMKFDAILAGVTAHEFIENILVRCLGARHVIVGDNFVFGHKRAGDTNLLHDMGKTHGFTVTAMPVVGMDDVRISSQAVREAIQAGRMGAAENLLDHPWVVRGEVARGDQRGRTIGFPTANIGMQDFIHPKFGVYAANVMIEEHAAKHDAVINIGSRPTFNGGAPLLEVHLFDFTGDLYGKTLRVCVREFLRPEQKFMDINALKDQIVKDVANAREILARIAKL